MLVDLLNRAGAMIRRTSKANDPMKVNYVTRSCRKMFAVRFFILIGQYY